ncbi:MAG: cupin domain-containing protein [Candidatus Hodarchaeota archaeon]
MIEKHRHLWGHEEWLENNELYCAKYLCLNKGYYSSLHCHLKKDETFIIMEGTVGLEILRTFDETVKSIEYHQMKPGDAYRIKPGTFHRFNSISDKSKILEVSTHHEDSDTIRLEKSHKVKELKTKERIISEVR